jgi:hypothetical protein
MKKEKNIKKQQKSAEKTYSDDEILVNPYVIKIKNNSKTQDHKVNLFGAVINTNPNIKNYGNDKDVEISPNTGYSYWSFLIKLISNKFMIKRWIIYVDGKNAEKQIDEVVYIKYINAYNGSQARVPLCLSKVENKNIEIIEDKIKIEFEYPVKIDLETSIEFNLLAGNKMELILCR